jgi:hypothetical protein
MKRETPFDVSVNATMLHIAIVKTYDRTPSSKNAPMIRHALR